MLPERLNYALVDEVDSILIDESRNPMIISLPIPYDQKAVGQVDKVCMGGGSGRNRVVISPMTRRGGRQGARWEVGGGRPGGSGGQPGGLGVCGGLP